MRRLIIVLCTIVSAAFTLSACNTVEGLGQDVEATGRTLQDWAGDDPAAEQPPADESDSSDESL